jgi:hypothetical protein
LGIFLTRVRKNTLFYRKVATLYKKIVSRVSPLKE